MRFPRLPLLPHAAIVALALAQGSPVWAQSTYAYSVTLTVTAPKGSAAETASKNKKLPAAIRFSPCDTTALDQFAFTIKYDAGKPAVGSAPSTLQNVYLVFHKDAFTAAFAPLPVLASCEGYTARLPSGVNVRVMTFGDGNKDIECTRIDVLYGFQTVRGIHASRVTQ